MVPERGIYASCREFLGNSSGKGHPGRALPSLNLESEEARQLGFIEYHTKEERTASREISRDLASCPLNFSVEYCLKYACEKNSQKQGKKQMKEAERTIHRNHTSRVENSYGNIHMTLDN